VSFAKKGKRAFSLDRAGVVREWDTEIGGCVDEVATRVTEARAAAIRADGGRIILHATDGSVIEWNLQSRTYLTELVATPETIVRLDADAAFAFVDTGEGDINLWDTRRWMIAGIVSRDRELRWLHAPSGRFVLFGRDGLASVIDGRDGTAIIEARLPDGFADAPRLHCDGRTLAAIGPDGSLRWIDLESGEMIEAGRGHDGAVTGLASAAGSTLIATVGADAMLRAYDVVTGALIASWEAEAPLTAVTVTASNRIAIADARGEVFMFV
jgi:WD40 repeat protein